ncbi:glycosyltransferase family 61 protein [uncultured Cohaesibacter sp.]|uniref:glycosyltransferase family 61 protein n=1 Tax=uncultured Cohaesibacter sp. TaxID=1002546 RepID=UPI002AA69802|nr:glycosyltransferase family 61 protein [uncultured Cohaesibacter sp.]
MSFLIDYITLWPTIMRHPSGLNGIAGGDGKERRLWSNRRYSKFLRLNLHLIYLRIMGKLLPNFDFSSSICFAEDAGIKVLDKSFSFQTPLWLWQESDKPFFSACASRRKGNEIEVKSRFRAFLFRHITLTAHNRDLYDAASNCQIASKYSFPIKIRDYTVRSASKTDRIPGRVFIDQTSVRTSNNYYHFHHAMTIACRLAIAFPSEEVRFVISYQGTGWKETIVAALQNHFDNLSFIQIDDSVSYEVEEAVVVSEETEWIFDLLARKQDYLKMAQIVKDHCLSMQNDKAHFEENSSAFSSLNKAYLSRPLALGRSIVNEDEFINRQLMPNGFTPIKPEMYSYSQQVLELFGQINEVITTPGAALTNLAFCKPDTFVTVIEDISQVQPFWNIYANIFGLHFINLTNGVQMDKANNYQLDLEKCHLIR